MSLLINKYRKAVFIGLMLVAYAVGLLFVDAWVLPIKTIDDRVAYLQNIRTGKDRYTILGTRFFTEKGYVFSLEKNNLKSEEVSLGQTMVFKNITSVKGPDKDYTASLISDLSGITLILSILLGFSSLLGVILLERKRNLSENAFLNIILLNGLLLICFIYMYFIQS